ncbi:MAG TPA: endo alpha-1,4 polygalactosaminidase [Flavobacterium sp.]
MASAQKRKSLLTLLGIIACTLLLACSKETKPGGRLAMKQVNSAEKMQEFITDISQYCRKSSAGFIIIPQNASELAFTDGNPELTINAEYMNAIDAFGIEGLFYNGEYTPDTTRLHILRKLQPAKKILVSEYISTDRHAPDVVEKNKKEGFVAFIRTKKNYNYEYIPKSIRNENAEDVKSMADVQNYLYLINASQYQTKADFIKTISKTNHDLLIIDLFFNNEPWTTSEIKKMKIKANGGERLVICYMNIGSAENWRYYWKKGWKLGSPTFLGKRYEGYQNEFWVRFWEPQWQEIIFGNEQSYAKKIINAGFDGAYLDNVEAYQYIFK